MTTDARIAALEIGFVELAKFLGRNQLLAVIQLATAMGDESRRLKNNAEITAAVAALASNFR